MRKLVLAVLFSVPAIVICVAALVAAEVSTGKFCSAFGPVSASPASLAVTQGAESVPGRRSIPRLLLP